MRAARTLRAIAQTTRYLEPGAPTGLTGLLTHSAPRSSLIYIYYNTLEKLKHLPESSVYRQSTEALTKHRLSAIESIKPEGLEAWRASVKSTVEAHPEAFQAIAAQADAKDVNFVAKKIRTRPVEIEGKEPAARREASPQETAERIHRIMVEDERIRGEIESLPAEPQLSVEQINEFESKIGAGLIEEIIQVAEGESQLVDTMIENKVWDELVEKPTEGQWVYHERARHTPLTQAPPKQ